MKKYASILIFVFAGCTGSLTKEQRKEMLKGRESTEIKRVSESDILAMALQKAKGVLNALANGEDAAKVDSTRQATMANIKWIDLDAPSNTVDKKLMEAYQQTDASMENIQMLGMDSVLITKSVFSQDSVRNKSQLTGMWRVSFSKKDLIKAM